MKKITYASRTGIVILLLLTYSFTFAFTIDGTVYDVETNEGIENAVVYLMLNNNWTLTSSDENGYYIYYDVEPNHYSFRVTATGYIEHNNAFTVSEDMTYDVYMEVQPENGYLSGTVTLDGGTGDVQSILITAGGETTNPDVDGNYSIEIQPGTYDVIASLEYYGSDTVTGVVVEEGIITDDVDLTLVYFDPPENLTVDEEIGLFTWDAPVSGNLTGYDIYLDSIFLENVTDTEFQFINLIYEQTYLAGVSAVYDDDISEIVEINFTYTPILYPPSNVHVDEYEGIISWEEPIITRTNMKTNSRDLLGYDVYLDSQLVGSTSDLEWQYVDLVHNQNYTAGVIAIYDEGPSEIIEIDFTYTGTDAGNDIVFSSGLIGNYPNPFNPTTTISFSVTQTSSFVNLDIFNLKGQKVKTLVNEKMSAGIHQIVWNGDDENNKPVSSGIYFYKLKSGVYTSTRKMILLK